MTVATQISGNIRPNNPAIDVLVSMLGNLGVRAAHPTDESFYINSQHPAWHHYDTQIALYESIAQSPFHIVFNDGPITEEVGRQILYALLKERPILMTGAPTFDATISPFAKEIIVKRFDTFHSMLLPGLEPSEMNELITRVKPVDYRLSENEKVLIHSRIKTHFRHLLEDARDIYVEKN